MNNKKKLSGKLRIRLAYIFFNVLLIANILTAIIFYILSFFKILIYPGKIGTFGLIVAMIITSLIIGTLSGYILSERYFRPLKQLSDASKKIANGDFSVSIEELKYKDDSTELNELIKNFNIMAEQLSKIETLRSDFIANVSHEFKTPLATIQGYVTLLEDDKLSKEERQNYLSIIFDATKKLTNLTSNILKISKLENQELEISKKEYNISEQLREVIILLQASWEKKNIEFDLDLEDCMIISDEELLQQVWMNIINNAIKFSNNDGKISVKLKSFSNYISIAITDNGCGMDEDTVNHIFDKFYQGDKSHSKEGNGLGLALVKRIVTLCRGEVSAKSKLNEGTTITVNLPIYFN